MDLTKLHIDLLFFTEIMTPSTDWHKLLEPHDFGEWLSSVNPWNSWSFICKRQTFSSIDEMKADIALALSWLKYVPH